MIEDYFQDLIGRLFVSPAVFSVRIVKRFVQEEEGTIRIKCRLRKAHKLEFAEYVQSHAGKIVVIAYNYHWQDHRNRLLKRWDNVPHHKEIVTFPHHLHLSETEVVSSGPTNLRDVLRQIEGNLLSPSHDQPIT
jgi:hypothetical protein